MTGNHVVGVQGMVIEQLNCCAFIGRVVASCLGISHAKSCALYK